MNNEKETIGFEGWAVVELFGHNQIAGYVSDIFQFGTSMMRIDVPEIDDNPGYTKMFGGAAIYAITPTTEYVARIAARRLDIRPISNWIVPENKPQLPRSSNYVHEDYQDEDEDIPWENEHA